MKYLLDTPVISELARRKPNPQVVSWIDAIDEDRLYLSVINIGEVARGIEKLSDSSRTQRLRGWLEELFARFEGRILPVDTAIMLKWGKLTARMERRGRPLPALDSLIAATALQADMSIVTRNERHFADTGISIVNPWVQATE